MFEPKVTASHLDSTIRVALIVAEALPVFPPTPDMPLHRAKRRQCAKRDRSAARQKASLFDHLVCARQDRLRDCYPKCLRGPQVDGQQKLCRQFDRQVGGPGAL